MPSRPIPIRVHGWVDSGYVVATLVVPRLLGWSGRSRRTLALVGLVACGYSALTRYPLGVVPLLPMPVHLGLDLALSLTVFGAQFELTEEESEVRLAFVALAAAGIAVAALTCGGGDETDDD